jgi:hypothetical protein
MSLQALMAAELVENRGTEYAPGFTFESGHPITNKGADRGMDVVCSMLEGICRYLEDQRNGGVQRGDSIFAALH